MPCFGYDRHEINFCCWYFPLIILFSYLLCYSSLFQILLKGLIMAKMKIDIFLCSVPLRYHLLISFLFIISISNQFLFFFRYWRKNSRTRPERYPQGMNLCNSKTCIAYILEHLYNRPHPSPTLPRILNIGLQGTLSRYIFKLKIFLCLAVVTL